MIRKVRNRPQISFGQLRTEYYRNDLGNATDLNGTRMIGNGGKPTNNHVHNVSHLITTLIFTWLFSPARGFIGYCKVGLLLAVKWKNISIVSC